MCLKLVSNYRLYVTAEKNWVDFPEVFSRLSFVHGLTRWWKEPDSELIVITDKAINSEDKNQHKDKDKAKDNDEKNLSSFLLLNWL